MTAPTTLPALRSASSPRTLVWFSCGAASAVAAKLAVETYGERCEVVTCDTISTEHPDNRRFFDDVQRWIGRDIAALRGEETRAAAALAAARERAEG